MYHAPTVEEIKAIRVRHGTSIFAARRILVRRQLSIAIQDAVEVGDLKDVMRVMLNELWRDEL